MQPTHFLPSQRLNVINVVLNTGFRADALTLTVYRGDLVWVYPWRSSLSNRFSTLLISDTVFLLKAGLFLPQAHQRAVAL